MNQCANCGSIARASDHYCYECGQKLHLHRLSWHDILHDGVHYFTHADKGVLQLLKSLTLTSGTVAVEYLAGKRKKYFAPLNFFLLVAAIYVLVSALEVKNEVHPDIKLTHPEISHIPDQAAKEKVYHIYERAENAKIFLDKHSNLIAILALPFTAFLFWVFYRRLSYSYVEHLVSNMYMSGYVLLVRALLFMPLAALISLSNKYIELTLFFAFQVIYCGWFYYRFTRELTTHAALKAGAVALFSITCWFALSGFLVKMYISNGLWGMFS